MPVMLYSGGGVLMETIVAEINKAEKKFLAKRAACYSWGGVGAKEVTMEWLYELLFAWWWWGNDGRTKTANAADTYVMPLLILVCVVCLIALVVYVVSR